jgi:hypothetical protein
MSALDFHDVVFWFFVFALLCGGWELLKWDLDRQSKE